MTIRHQNVSAEVTKGQSILAGNDASESGDIEQPKMATRSAARLREAVPGLTEMPNYTEIASLYGKCTPLFDLCSDNALTSFCHFGTQSPLIDRLNFTPTNLYTKKRNFITYVSNFGTAAGEPVSTNQGELCCDDGCEPGPTVEFGTADYECKGFDSFKVSSPVRKDECETIRYCEQQPIYTINGTQINDNDIWDMMMMSGVIAQDMHRWLLDKLRTLVNFGYVDTSGMAVPQMDACVVDWGCQVLCDPDEIAPGSITVNGMASAAGGFTFIDLLEFTILDIKRRVQWSPNLPNNGFTNAIFMVPFEAIECILRCYVCHRVCGCDITRMDNMEARNMLNDLRNSGEFGVGSITLHGVRIDLMPWDYGDMIDTETECVEAFLLTPQIGNQLLIDAEFQDMNVVANRSKMEYDSVNDGGLMAFYSQVDHGCYQSHAKMNPRMCIPAPWAQVRFTGLQCNYAQLKGFRSCDPLSPYFIGGTNLTATDSTCEPCPDDGAGDGGAGDGGQ